MVDIGALPIASIGSIITILINAIIVWIILMVVGKVIIKTLDFKRTLILAVVALFVAPFVVLYAGLSGIIAVYIIPLIVWIVLGEILIKGGDMKSKLKVIIIAFVVYIILNYAGVPGMVSSLFAF